MCRSRKENRPFASQEEPALPPPGNLLTCPIQGRPLERGLHGKDSGVGRPGVRPRGCVMNRGFVALEQDRRPRAAEPAPPAEGRSGEPDRWFLVWVSDRRGLLVSEAGHLLICPHPGQPFTC